MADWFGYELIFEGSGMKEIGIDKKSNKVLIRIDSANFRPTEVDSLLGDPTKAKKLLGWSPTIDFDQLVHEMCLNDDLKAKAKLR